MGDDETENVPQAARAALETVRTLGIDLGEDRLQVALDDVLDLVAERLARLAGGAA